MRAIRFSSEWLLLATGLGPQGFHQDFLQQLDEIQTKTMTLCASDSGEALHVAARAGRAIGERASMHWSVCSTKRSSSSPSYQPANAMP